MNNILTNFYTLLENIPPLIYYIILIFPIIIFLVYCTLYKYLKLEVSTLSFICFFINNLIFFSFIVGIFHVFYKGFPNPIYLENLSSLANYRYLILSFFVIIAILIFLLSLKYTKLKMLLEKIRQPYFKEEMHLLLKANAFLDDILGKLCIWLIKKM